MSFLIGSARTTIASLKNGEIGTPGPAGEDGKTSYVHIAYSNSEDGSLDFSTSDSSNRAYIGMYTDFIELDSTDHTKYTWQRTKGDQGESGRDGIAGKDGVGLKNTEVSYAKSTNGQTPPEIGWTEQVPVVPGGQFLWTKTTWTYTDNSSESGYSVSKMGQDGNKGDDGIAGKDGVGISETVIEYSPGNDGVTKPTTGWSSAIPTVAAGKYLWTRTTWSYTDGTSEVGYTVAKQGEKGDKGDKGDTGRDGIAGKDGVGLRSTAVTYAASTSGTTSPATGWQEQVPTVAPDNFLWTRTVWTYSDGTSETGYSVAKMGRDGAKGDDGIAGKDGVGIDDTLIEYAVSTSGTTKPASGWSTTIPTVPQGQYLWTRTTWTYTDNTTEQGFTVARQGEKGDKGDQGITGPKGADGRTQYTHIAYADTASGGGFSQSPTGKAYIGMYVDFEELDSSDPKKYAWSLIKGADGEQGVAGPKGEDGRTPYFHTAYINSNDFGAYDYSGNPNLMRVIKASDFKTETDSDVTISDIGYNSIRLTSQGTGLKPFAAYTLNNISSLVSGKTYTISAKVKIEEGTTGNIDKLRIAYRKTLGGTILLSANTKGAEVGKEIIIKGTGIVSYNITDLNRFYLSIGTEAGSTMNGSVIVSDIKIEEGSTATPYQPNLKDDPWYFSTVPLGENIADPSKTFPIKTSSYNIYRGKITEKYQVNQTYTITMKATKPASQQFGVYLLAGAMGVGNMKPVEGLTDVWQLTFKVTQAHIDGGITDLLDVYQLPQSTIGSCQIDWLKFEKGDIRTPNIDSYKYLGNYTDFVQDDSLNPTKYSWSLIKGADGTDGAPAKTLTLQADSPVMKFDTNDVVVAGQVITFTAVKQNFDSNITWVATPYKGNIAQPAISLKGTGDVRTLESSMWPSGVTTIRVDISADSFRDSVTITKVKDGAKGDKGTDGIAGKDGVGIQSTDITYAGSSNGTTPPSTGWNTQVPTVPAGQYLWTKTVWTYTDNSNETGYSVARMGADGAKGDDGIAGKDGVGIKDTLIEYAVNTSGTTRPTSGWSTSIPNTPQGQYLWTRTTWTYTDNTTEQGFTVARQGSNGQNGANGTDGSDGKSAFLHTAWSDIDTFPEFTKGARPNVLRKGEIVTLNSNNSLIYPIYGYWVTDEDGRVSYRVTRRDLSQNPTKLSLFNGIGVIYNSSDPLNSGDLTEPIVGKKIIISGKFKASTTIEMVMMATSVVNGVGKPLPKDKTKVTVTPEWQTFYTVVDKVEEGTTLFRFLPSSDTSGWETAKDIVLAQKDLKIEIVNDGESEEPTPWVPPITRKLFNPKNLFEGGNSRTPTAYSGAIGTVTKNVSVPEWGATDAWTFSTTGGTSVVKATLGIKQTGSSLADGKTYYRSNFHIKNNHDQNILTVSSNGGIPVNIPPGSCGYFGIPVNQQIEKNNLQWNFVVSDVSMETDFTIWNPEFYAYDIDHNFTETQPSTSLKYLGTYTDNNPKASGDPKDYDWNLVKGNDGSDGKPAFFHTAWANSPDGTLNFSKTDSLNKSYIGTYSDNIQEGSNDPTKYKWTELVGALVIDSTNYALESRYNWRPKQLGSTESYYNILLDKPIPKGTKIQVGTDYSWVSGNKPTVDGVKMVAVTSGGGHAGVELNLTTAPDSGTITMSGTLTSEMSVIRLYNGSSGKGQNNIYQFENTVVNIGDKLCGWQPNYKDTPQRNNLLTNSTGQLGDGNWIIPVNTWEILSPEKDKPTSNIFHSKGSTSVNDMIYQNPHPIQVKSGQIIVVSFDYKENESCGNMFSIRNFAEPNKGLASAEAQENWDVPRSLLEKSIQNEWIRVTYRLLVRKNGYLDFILANRSANASSQNWFREIMVTTNGSLQGDYAWYQPDYTSSAVNEANQTIPRVYVQSLAPQKVKDGDQWWKMNNNKITNYYVYGGGKWNEQTIDQSVLNIATLNAVNINGSVVAGSTFVNEYTNVTSGLNQVTDGSLKIENGILQAGASYYLTNDQGERLYKFATTDADIHQGTVNLRQRLYDESGTQTSESTTGISGGLITLSLSDSSGNYHGVLDAKALTRTPWKALQLDTNMYAVAENNPPMYRIIYNLDGSKTVKFKGQFMLKSGNMKAGTEYYPFRKNGAGNATLLPDEIRPNQTEFGFAAAGVPKGQLENAGGRIGMTRTPTMVVSPGIKEAVYFGISSLTYDIV